jgi:hypothetical protein
MRTIVVTGGASGIGFASPAAWPSRQTPSCWRRAVWNGSRPYVTGAVLTVDGGRSLGPQMRGVEDA